MAITGSGTQADPWKVHSYDELKTVTTNRTYLPNYGKAWTILDADINCNDYGSDFEWETINLGATGSYSVPYGAMSFDLNGHTIKNVSVKKDNMMFNANFSASNNGDAEFKGNGKLLNIFTQPSSTAYLIKGMTNKNTISNLALSISLGNLAMGVFMNTKVENSALYIEQAETSSSGSIILQSDNNVGSDALCTLKNCDVLLNIGNQHICLVNSYHGTDNYTTITDCRIRGKSKATSLPAYYICPHKVANSVVDLDMTEATYASSLGDAYRRPMKAGSSGVINSNKKPSNQPDGYYTNGMSAVTNEQIINGDALRAANFTVVNVVR